MSNALPAVERLRQRRLQRNRRNPGTHMRYGDGAFLSEAEEAAERLAMRERDEAIVAAALAEAGEQAARDAEAAKTAVPVLDAAKARYIAAAQRVYLALQGGTLKVKPGTEKVEVVGLLDAIRECAETRQVYESEWSQADKYGVADERVMPLAIGAELNRAMSLAQQA